MDDLVERNDLYYKKFTNVPFTGMISGIQNGNFKNGKKDGEWLHYHQNGQLKMKGNLKGYDLMFYILNTLIEMKNHFVGS